MPWNVRVDPQLCLASGMCAGVAPEVFALDGEHARVRAEVAEGTEGAEGIVGDERVLDAADICPALAITVHDGDKVIAPTQD